MGGVWEMEALLAHARNDSVYGSVSATNKNHLGKFKTPNFQTASDQIIPGSLKVAVRIWSFQNLSGIPMGGYLGNHWLEPCHTSLALVASVSLQPRHRVEWEVGQAQGRPELP